MTATTSMALQLLPSFQTFLASARTPSSLVFQHKPAHYESMHHQQQPKQKLSDHYYYHSSHSHSHSLHYAAPRMYHLAALTAREYENALRSPASPTSTGYSSPRDVSMSPTDESEVSSDEERLVAAARRSESHIAPSRANASQPAPYRTKKKYLKEKQRCEIVRRVRGGEKQAHLAKEFGVSRAAVCYLLKHQTEILSRSNTTAM